MKMIWKVSILAVVAGLLLIAIGFATGAERSGMYWDNGPKLVRYGDVKVMEDTFDEFKNIDLDVDFGDIEFVAADRYVIELRGYEDEWTWNVSGDTLSVTQSAREQNRFMIFSFNTDDTPQHKATVYLPRGAQLERVSIYAGSGDIVAGDFAAKDTVIESGFGSVILSDLTSDSIDATLGSGDFVGTNLNADSLTYSSGFGSGNFTAVTASQFSADSSSGGINLENCVLTNASVTMGFGDLVADGISTGSLVIDSGSGDVNVDGALAGKTVITAGFGLVKVDTESPISDYSYDIETGFGDMVVDGEDTGTHAVNNGGARNRLEINASSGDVIVDFGR